MIEIHFSWVNTHKQIVNYLEKKENAQIELIDLLKSVGIEPFNDKISPEGHNIPLEEIDPFTFFCYIYKYGSQKRLELLQAIARKLMIDIPSDEKGLPSAQPQKVWLFPYKYARNNNEVPRLWSFFRKAINEKITDIDFQDILTIKSVGKTKLTEALFYIMPDMYLPINGPTKPYIEEKLNIIPKFNTYTEYISLLNQIRSKTNIPFYELSYQAWEWNKDKNNNMVDSLKYSDQLKTFLAQANTKDLKTKHYIKSYHGTNVKVSFGIGGIAEIPWISFLKEPFTTSNGIYPVYLYYKGLNLLILAYGISETKVPDESWNIQNPLTISEYFKENNLGKPKRYGSSYIHKVYDVSSLPNEKVLDHDLNQLIEFYLNIKVQKNNEVRESPIFDSLTFIESLNNSGLIFNHKLITRFISSLLTKNFVILSGLSGSGKTKLAQAFVQWICQDESQYCIVPVGADWTNREPLLGYPNALKPNEYIKPDNGALDLIIEANKKPELPYFLILDEMNLSHVERYFSDFLSVMETKGEISLFAEGSVNNGVPAKLVLPANLFIIGTVNIDETTYMFSPKVLDRANTIEFRVIKDEIIYFFSNRKDIDMNQLKMKGAPMAQSFLKMAEKREFETQDLTGIHNTLVIFFEQLKKTGAEFGYRSATEIIRLINQLTVIGIDLSPEEKLDIAMMQKLLPKLHGSRRKLCPVLITLGGFCVKKSIVNVEKEVFAKEDFDFTSDAVIYPISLEKITRMYRGAIENGFTSYAEA
jgi:5-methylcytosine-specific restriction protein B